ncbi:MAG: GTPase [Solirubrobacterales bacterium]
MEFEGLAEAIDATVTGSEATSDVVQETLAQVATGLEPVFAELKQRRKVSGRLAADVGDRLDLAVDTIAMAKEHMRDRRRQLQDFRMAMFGRTGTGKSSLIEALTQGDASSVSPGQGDHTEDVRQEGWGPLLVTDMPGILGAGRRLSRAELESRAEAEVKLADLVLLAFDSQNQQAAEFERAAQMVVRYGKPVIAVLNVRNPRWRSPDPSFTTRKRRKRDLDVAQHVSHLEQELSRIGIHACPIVAINTQRATFARCDPYRAPAFGEVRDRQVTEFGKAVLEESSNIRALEETVIRLVTGSCGELREAGLQGDLRAALGTISKTLDDLPGLDECEAGLDRLLRDVGYPRDSQEDVVPLEVPPIAAKDLGQSDEDDRRLSRFEARTLKVAADESVHALDGVTRASVTTQEGDELAELEQLRGKPFGASNLGKMHRRLDQRMTIAFQPARLESLRRVEDVVLAATKGKTVNASREILRLDEQMTLAAATIDEAIADACGMLDRNAARVAASFAIRSASIHIEVGGRGERTGSLLARAGGLGAGAGLAIATTNFWNPGGWIVGALSVGAIVGSFLGSRLSKRAEEKRLRARARSIAKGRQIVNDAFDQLEQSTAQTFWAALTTIVASRAIRPLRDAADLHLVSKAAALVAVIEVSKPSGGTRAADVPPREVLLGTGWAPRESGSDDGKVHSAPVIDPAVFEELGWGSIAEGLPDRVMTDAFQALEELLQDRRFADVRRRVHAIMERSPVVAICGDYSSAKSSIRAVLTRSTSPSRRRVKRGADPTTPEVEVGRMNGLKILDTPGLGSSRPSDIAKAEQAAEDASLVLYLVTPRLIADIATPLIDQLGAFGLAGEIARLRTRFVLTRIDELGASPTEAPREFVATVQNKRQELARVLDGRGISVDPGAIIPVSPDPFGSDFDDQNLRETALWNGIERLTLDLQGFSETADRRPGALAAAISEFGRITNAASNEISSSAVRVSERHGMLRATERAQRETLDLALEFRAKLESAVVPVVTEIVDHAMSSTGKEQEAAIKQAKNWWADPRITTELDRWQKRSVEALQGHIEAVNSELGRQFEAIYSTGEFEQPPEFADSAPASLSNLALVGEGAGQAATHLAKLDAPKVLAIRDSLTKLPVSPERLRFKPWGATKLADKAKLAGKVAAIAGIVIELGVILHDESSKKKQEKIRRRAHEQVMEELGPWFDGIMDGDKSTVGLSALLTDQASKLDVSAARIREDIMELESRAAQAGKMIDLIDAFMSEASDG